MYIAYTPIFKKKMRQKRVNDGLKVISKEI